METVQKLKLFSKVNFIILYGSVNIGKQTPLSDVDICISLSLNAKERLRARIKLLGALPESYDIQIFEDLPLYVQKEVLAGEILYCKNKKNLIKRALALIAEYDDFEPIYEYYLARNKAEAEI